MIISFDILYAFLLEGPICVFGQIEVLLLTDQHMYGNTENGLFMVICIAIMAWYHQKEREKKKRKKIVPKLWFVWPAPQLREVNNR